jgi:hypothetical protein
VNFLALAKLLFTIFGPVLAEWLKGLIERAGPPLPDYPVQTSEAITSWFAAARARTTWLEYVLFARRRLRALERAALAHSGEIAAALRFGAAPPVLSGAEAQDLAGEV